jgi:hypothetical protein
MAIYNSQIAVYTTSNQQLAWSVSLASFFNYTTQGLFDPRAMFDKTWKRWIVTAEAFPESSTVQMQFIAISRSEDPTTGYWIYSLDVNPINDVNYFWDFPQVGQDQDAIIITANVFNPGFIGASMLAVAKARLYNGLGWSVPWWHPSSGSGLVGTLAPPIVLDQNTNTYLLAAPPYVSPGGTAITKYTLTNSAKPNGTTLTSSTITAPLDYFIPPNGRQPGTAETLDSLDCRFGNWSTQNGNSIWNAHSMTFGSGTWAWSYWYEFDTVTNAVLNFGSMVSGGNSDDFMPHVTVNTSGDLFAVWTASDGLSAIGHNAQMRISGRQVADANLNIGPGSIVIQSPSIYTQGRWGDYQCVDVAAGPGWGNSKVGFAIGEYVTGTNFWESRISRMAFP